VELTVNELVRRVLAMTGSRSRVVSRPLPVDDPQRRRPDTARAQALLGWTARTPLEQGLEATVAWFEAELAPARPPLRAARVAARL
jgi:UDP-glucuronate decarboxylase